MKIQYIFGNPQKGKRKMAKRKKVKRKARRKAPTKRVARKKVTRKITRKTRRKSTKKNPMKVDVVVRAKKGKKAGEVLYSESSGIMRTPSEIRKLELHIDKLRESKYRTKSRTAKKAIDKRIAEIKKDLVRDKSMRRAGLKQLSSTRKIRRDYAAAPRYSKEGVAEEIVVKRNTVIYPETRRKSKVARKRKTTKRKIVKRKTAKRKTTRRKARRKVAKVTAEVRAGKTTTGGKIKAKRRLKKGQSISKVVSRKRRKYKMSLKRTNPKRRRRNPMALPMGMTMSAEGLKLKGVTLTGFEMSEIGELAAGGLLYGAINGALPKVPLLGQLQSLLMRVPVVGTSLTPFVLGMALNFISGKFLGRRGMGKMLEHLGDGLVAASVVGMGVNASQLVPFLTPGGTVSGVDYTPNYGALPQADFGKSADFGAIDYFPKYSGVDFTPDFSGVDYTPNFSGVDYTPDFSGPDFGADADFGETPEGLYGIPTGLN